jgi:hypothetical protein
MMAVDTTNPVVAGLLGGLALLLLQMLWDKIMGDGKDMSIPAQLAKIQVALADINIKLELIKQNNEFASKAFDELKSDFYKHIERFHGGA